MRVLLLEGDRHRAELMCRSLIEQGYVVEVVAEAALAVKVAVRGDFDAAVVPVVLCGDGGDLCRRLRREGYTAPILAGIDGSAREEAARVLDAGADVCLVDPWRDLEHLAATLRALLRRHQPAAYGDVLRVGELSLDLSQRRVRVGRTLIHLTKKEFDLLHCLMRNADRLVTRASIGSRVWGTNLDVESNVIDVCIHNLRSKITSVTDRNYIHTLRGSGYMLTAVSEGEEVSGKPRRE